MYSSQRFHRFHSFVHIFAISTLVLTGCQNMGKRTSPQEPARPTIIQPNDDAPTSQIPSSSDVVNVPGFVTVKAPRVGIIFGPGGAKTLAQIGALQELERQKIPVVATVGLEWGALIGALYSLNGQSQEVDWQISKLPKVSFSATNIFSKKMQATKAASYNTYLNSAFKSERLESTKLPFACTYIKNDGAGAAILSKGVIRNVLRSCWQYPPLFSVAESKAAPYAVGDAVAYLRKNGAELIVMINVLESQAQKDFSGWDDSAWQWFSWVPVSVAIKSAQKSGVNETINLDTSAFSMTDFDQRLRLIQVGKQGAASQIDQLIKKYDF